MFNDRSRSVLPVSMWLTKMDAVIGLLVSSLFINLLGLAFPIVLLQIYDRIIPNQSKETLVVLILIVLGALLLETILKIMRAYVSSWANARFTYNVDKLLFNKLMYSNLSDFDEQTSGVHLEKFNNAESIREFYCGQNLVMIVDLPFLIIYLGLMFAINMYMAAVPVVMIVCMIVFSGTSQPLTKKRLEDKSQLSEVKSKFLIEMISGIHTIKSMAMEEQFLRRYERLHERELNQNYELIQRLSQNQRMSALFSQLVVIFTAAMGGYLVVNQDITVGGLAACIMLSGKVMQPVIKLVSFWEKRQNLEIAKEDLKHILGFEQEYAKDLKTVEHYSGDVELRNVKFKYKEAETETFTSISLKVSTNDVIAIHGESHSGKSTLLALMCTLYKPTDGQILFDGIDMHELDLDDFRRHIAYLPQNGELFNGTIMDNLTIFEHDKYGRKAMELAKAVGLHDVIETMPSGYQTDVGKGTVDLISAGQKQQVLTVRALLEDPKLILFDEANMAMDIESDIKLRKFLLSRKGKCTIIMVTHRPSLLEMADKHYEIKNGKLEKIEWK